MKIPKVVFPDYILAKLTRIALDGAAKMRVPAAKLARHVKVPAAELSNGHVRTLSEKQLDSLARAVGLSLPELLVKGDPTGRRLGFTPEQQRATARLFRRSRLNQEWERKMIQEEAAAKPRRPARRPTAA